MKSHARAQHIDIARALATMAQHDLPQAIAWLGAALHLLQRELLISDVEVEPHQPALEHHR